MHKPSLAQIVHSAIFPRPRTSDPATFSAHITRNLVPEVRIETSTFYGSLDSIEAQYPGLDYSYGPHRMRLGRFPWHRKLFKVFDELGLTETEISSLCRWEGTKSARERYEKEEGIKVRDTTAEAIRPATPSPRPSVEIHFDGVAGSIKPPEVTIHEPFEDVVTTAHTVDDRVIDRLPQPHKVEEDSSDEEMESCGVELNHRLLAATAAREQGANVPLDEDWEQWLKEVGERGSYADLINAIRTGQPLNFLPNMASPLAQLRRTGIAQISPSLPERFMTPAPPRVLSSGVAIRRPPNPPPGTAR
ncbi:uncharacterized protein ACLA_030090 [Aspergillus clavatus NRRL 1]|uniref:Uncharacterized protein n=1 Tax=Aspergillus clavatus (strain ATCC 1007 / CBS 513.65 / DSM 816 / NCTC 3887 / NRRL 1 / QM 1276 / 107) TaxID=344612 RepID=A1CRK5_ASPCL|nr:uncharacterized protein ACLA_030090 [Aspergillus clavatus NRRL 1]EAW08276.1 conserved hypothetical protein [Aspergillus clavatus NRRL 1]